MAGYNIDPCMCAHLRCLPASHGELIFCEFACMVLFGAIAAVLAAAYFLFTGAFALLYVCRSGIGNGAAFPVSVLLALYTVSESARNLVTEDQLIIALMIGSMTVAFLQMYALLKGP